MRPCILTVDVVAVPGRQKWNTQALGHIDERGRDNAIFLFDTMGHHFNERTLPEDVLELGGVLLSFLDLP